MKIQDIINMFLTADEKTNYLIELTNARGRKGAHTFLEEWLESSYEEAIWSAFFWDETMQGHQYWELIHEKIIK